MKVVEMRKTILCVKMNHVVVSREYEGLVGCTKDLEKDLERVEMENHHSVLS